MTDTGRSRSQLAGTDYLLYGITIFGWSTSWIAIHMQLGIVAPEVSLVWRFGLSAIVMFIWALLARVRIVFPLRAHPQFLALGLFLFGINYLGFYYGGRSTPSGLLALVFSCAALFNIVLGLALFGQTASQHVTIGAAAGLAGVFLMFAPRIFSEQFDQSALLGLGLCVLATLSFCIGNMFSIAIQKKGITIVAINAWGMTYGTLFLAFFAFARGQRFVLEPSWTYVTSLLWLSLVASAVVFMCYLTLLGRIGAARAGYATVVVPVFALLISTFVEDFRWSAASLAGLALAIIGNVLVMRKGSVTNGRTDTRKPAEQIGR
jgi:drug/metabolite transporter (DMT)-like permease